MRTSGRNSWSSNCLERRRMRLVLEIKLRKHHTHRRNFYDGHNSGGRHGPSNAIKRAVLREYSIIDKVFFSCQLLKKCVNG